MANVININRRIEQSIERLLERHQAVIDAWYANWLEEQRAKAVAWAKRKALSNGERG